MTLDHDASTDSGSPRGLAALLRTMSYEVMPNASAQQEVLAEVPTTIPLSVTATEARGLETTLAFTEDLRQHQYSVTPHLPARLFLDRAHVTDVAARLSESGVTSVFVVGGDSPHPAGEFGDAHSLLVALSGTGYRFDEVGVAGYPEGHASLSEEQVREALRRKAPMTTHLVSQICFQPRTTVAWAQGISASDSPLPVRVGMPGPVNRHKLMRIAGGLGLGQSARFLRKQHTLIRRLLRPRGYDPTAFARRLVQENSRLHTGIHGVHIFTFNELRGTERWRRQLLSQSG